MHYLDNSATTPVIAQAAQAAYEAMTQGFGNPSSLHEMGTRANALLKKSRQAVADALGAEPGEVIFTSGGTESINTAISGACRKNFRLGKHIVATEIEHSATLECLKRQKAEGFEITLLKPDCTGNVSAEQFAAALREDTILVSCMLVNNETGAVLPVEEIGEAVRRLSPKALFHIDAVQGFFRVKMEAAKWHADLMSVSGHKIGAPKGIGALYIRKGVKLPPLLYGGGQENGMRPGTEPMQNIAAFAEACRIRAAQMGQDLEHVTALNSFFRKELDERFPWAIVNGGQGVPHVVNVSFPGCKSEVMLRILEGNGVYVSSGSACAKGKASHVLRAMGLEKERIDSALRVSFAPFNTREDIVAFFDAAGQGAARLRR